jgi:MYXO-CTERM domain-containing protein
VQHDVPEIGLKAASATVPHAGALPAGPGAVHRGGACGACRIGDGSPGPTVAALVASLVAALAWLARRREK